VRRFTYAASSSTYGDHPDLPKVEEKIGKPLSPYAVTKYVNELYADVFSRSYGIETVGLRYFNVFGPRQDPNSAYAAAVPIFLHRAKNNEPITIYGDGGQTRDFIYVKDIVGALAFAAETPEAQGVFNTGYGSALTIRELVQEILKLTGSHSEIRHEPDRAGDIRHSTSDASKLRAAGWKPRFDVLCGLKELVGPSIPSTR
jgi:UDP-glucose 4-epimerase